MAVRAAGARVAAVHAVQAAVGRRGTNVTHTHRPIKIYIYLEKQTFWLSVRLHILKLNHFSLELNFILNLKTKGILKVKAVSAPISFIMSVSASPVIQHLVAFIITVIFCKSSFKCSLRVTDGGGV